MIGPVSTGDLDGDRSLFLERLRSWGGPALGLALVTVAAVILHHEVVRHPLRDILTQLRAIPRSAVALAMVLTVVDYVVLTGYDALAVRYVRAALSYPKIALASFIGFVFSHNVGFSFFGGTAVRFRILSSFGVRAADIARIATFNLLTFWVGCLTVGGVALCLHPVPLPGALADVFGTSRLFGALMLAGLAAYVAVTALRRPVLRIHGFEIPLPGAGLTLSQVAISSADWLLAASVFYVLLPSSPGLSFPLFLAIFVVGQIAGLLSQVPAGLGVFDSIQVLLLSSFMPADAVLGSVVAYRLVYYLLPMASALALFAGFEVLERRRHLERARAVVERWLPAIVPRAFSAALLLAGAVLLFSGATPEMPSRLRLLGRLLPLPVLELSHFLGSVIGVGLVLLARAVQRRVDAAYPMGLSLLAAGIVVSLVKGLDWGEAAILGATFVALLPCRAYFYRKSPLLSQPFTTGWVAGLTMLMVGVVVLTLVAYRNVQYSNQLWWEFELSRSAPRSLRALMGAFGALAAFALARLLRPTPPAPTQPGPPELARVARIVAGARRASAHLALVGDKEILFHPAADAFLMYGIEGRSWISMGDPIGDATPREDLAWQFRELADLHGGRAVFYEVSTADLPIYLELGLDLFKVGEEARVPLPDFSLEGSGRKGLRQTRSRALRDGCSFEVVAPEGVPPLLDELQQISNTWLAMKHTREKRFSLGFFDRRYLSALPCALVRREGRIVAFANLWPGGGREELSSDMMRFDDQAPASVMEFLLIELMLWGRQQGYRWYGLGMAPLSGFESRPQAPVWSRVGGLLFQYGEHFYNFRGLRAFKEKFDPTWEPRYLASPGGLRAGVVLTQVASLVGGGVGGVVSR